MPELPEVETIARGLASLVSGDEIESIWLGQKREPLKSSARDIAAALENSCISTVRRVGKHIVFELERDGVERTFPSATSEPRSGAKARQSKAELPRASSRADAVAGKRARPTRANSARALADEGVQRTRAQWIVHLGMTGRLQVCEPRAEIAKHTHAILKLASGRELRFVDPRRFGRLSVTGAEGFQVGGIEPLEIDLERFVSLFRGRKTPIKSALLNQKLLRGVGNIYADEALFRAGIRPRRRASTITREQFAGLLAAVKEVLKEAIALGGSSISDYLDAEGAEGFFQLQHRVYGREDESCLACKTPIKRVVIAGRSSHYCPRCQK